MHALKVFRSPVWPLLHKLSSPHYRYVRKMRRDDRLPLTQPVPSQDHFCDFKFYQVLPFDIMDYPLLNFTLFVL